MRRSRPKERADAIFGKDRAPVFPDARSFECYRMVPFRRNGFYRGATRGGEQSPPVPPPGPGAGKIFAAPSPMSPPFHSLWGLSPRTGRPIDTLPLHLMDEWCILIESEILSPRLVTGYKLLIFEAFPEHSGCGFPRNPGQAAQRAE